MADPTIILDIELDWSENPAITYSFSSSLQDTPYFVEQRRPLLPAASRTLSYKFTESNSTLERLRNTLLAAKAELICVPIFSEPIVAVSIVTGGSSITATTDLTYFWNIKNCSYVVLIDIVTGQSEMLGVASVSGQLIRFATNIVNTWVAAQTIIYPAMAASLKAVKEGNILSKTASIDAEFEETTLGAEATSEWVGLDEQICVDFSVCLDTIVTPAYASSWTRLGFYSNDLVVYDGDVGVGATNTIYRYFGESAIVQDSFVNPLPGRISGIAYKASTQQLLLFYTSGVSIYCAVMNGFSASVNRTVILGGISGTGPTIQVATYDPATDRIVSSISAYIAYYVNSLYVHSLADGSIVGSRITAPGSFGSGLNIFGLGLLPDGYLYAMHLNDICVYKCTYPGMVQTDSISFSSVFGYTMHAGVFNASGNLFVDSRSAGSTILKFRGVTTTLFCVGV